MAEKLVGQRLKRTEDPRLIKGLAHYVDDIKLPDTLHAVFVRSIYAHARSTIFDYALVNSTPVSPDMLEKYIQEGAEQDTK